MVNLALFPGFYTSQVVSRISSDSRVDCSQTPQGNTRLWYIKLGKQDSKTIGFPKDGLVANLIHLNSIISNVGKCLGCQMEENGRSSRYD